MNSIINILWIEDESITGLVEYKAHLETTDDFNLKIVDNASDAEIIINENGSDFDIILIDIRIPPGYNTKWVSEYQNTERLGIKLINDILENPELNYLKSKIGISSIERWKDIQQWFTNGHDIVQKDQFLHKIEADTPEILEQFIRKINNKNGHTP